MKKLLLSFMMLWCALGVMAGSVAFLSNPQNNIQIVSKSSNHIEFINSVGKFSSKVIKTPEGYFQKLIIPGYSSNNDYGNPDLPQLGKLIEIPVGASPVIEILSYDEEVVDLNEFYENVKLFPCQPSVSKSNDPDNIPFSINNDIYSEGLYEVPAIRVEESGTFRGVKMAKVVVSPFQYNVEENELIIKDNIRVRITFEGADLATTRSNKSKYYSPAFESAYSGLWNHETFAQKDALSHFPVKYVIVSDPMFQETLQPFIIWKRQMGFDVIEAYTNDENVGNTRVSIKSYLHGLYNSATETDPAPSYVLFVGDVDQIPAWNGNSFGNHITDLYYCTYDGSTDYIPDMYYGRFSANNVEELQPQIDKTLQFEKYTMPDPSYLEKSVFVAGSDNYFAPTHGNGQVTYASNEYFNAAHGVELSAYYYPASSSQASTIIAEIGEGAGFVNYTAHCSSQGWDGPEFEISDISTLDNQDQYYVSIGNCCLSNKFNETCFGEMLLRTPNEGAVVHIGASNSSYWDEDFYWSVGLSSAINVNQTYESTETGMYDALFHEQGEDPHINCAQMINIGNMAVESSSSVYKKYYWEIYHVMGDPSLMPYVGIPEEIEVEEISDIPSGASTIDVDIESGAMVAVSQNDQLIDVVMSTANGATLDLSDITVGEDFMVVATKQFKQPLITTVSSYNASGLDAQLSSITLPETYTHISNATCNPEIKLVNAGSVPITQVTLSLEANNEITEFIWVGNLEPLDFEMINFDECFFADGVHQIKAWASNPNGEEDVIHENDTVIKEVTVYSGSVSSLHSNTTNGQFCNVTDLIPSLTIQNTDTYPLTECVVSYTLGNQTEEISWTGNLESTDTAVVEFPAISLTHDNYNIVYSVESVNNGSDLNMDNNQLEESFDIVMGESITLEFLTDNYAEEVSWELLNDNDEVIETNGALADEEMHITKWCLTKGCYKFKVMDTNGDGMAGFMGSASGNVKLMYTDNEELIKEFSGTVYKSSYIVDFCVRYLSVDDDKIDSEISIYPNPTKDIVNIDGDNIEGIEIFDISGRLLSRIIDVSDKNRIDVSGYNTSILVVRISSNDRVRVEKLILNND